MNTCLVPQNLRQLSLRQPSKALLLLLAAAAAARLLLLLLGSHLLLLLLLLLSIVGFVVANLQALHVSEVSGA